MGVRGVAGGIYAGIGPLREARRPRGCRGWLGPTSNEPAANRDVASRGRITSFTDPSIKELKEFLRASPRKGRGGVAEDVSSLGSTDDEEGDVPLSRGTIDKEESVADSSGML